VASFSTRKTELPIPDRVARTGHQALPTPHGILDSKKKEDSIIAGQKLTNMTTVLQRQLAAIASNSTHQLDLKAKKAAHGKSLLFDPKVAVSQDFNTLYQICFEGFEELCALDSRFVAYSNSIFSEQSKTEEREQMTAEQNKELDAVLESFLGLVGERLALKPAQKAVEWLVRRFRCVIPWFMAYSTANTRVEFTSTMQNTSSSPSCRTTPLQSSSLFSPSFRGRYHRIFASYTPVSRP
jgi:plasmid maintenance system killer protein